MNDKLNDFIWLIKREFWEHKSFLTVPLVIIGIFTLTDIVAMMRGSEHLGLARDALDAHGEFNGENLGIIVEVLFAGIGSILAVAMFIVAFFYLLDCLYAERRDRSVLFWKSIPVTDRATVLSKYFTGVVILPIIAVLATLVSYFILMLILSIVFGSASGFPLSTVWNPLNIIGAAGSSLALSAMTQTYLLPVTAWLLFCSAFAKKAPTLFAIFIPAGLILAEHLALGKSYLAEAIGSYFKTFGINIAEKGINIDMDSFDFGAGGDHVDVDGGLPGFGDFFELFTEPMTYAGLTVAAVFVVLSIWWRRNRIDYG